MKNSSRKINTNFEPYCSTVRNFSDFYAEFYTLTARNFLLANHKCGFNIDS